MNGQNYKWRLSISNASEKRSVDLDTLKEALEAVEPLGTRNELSQWKPSPKLTSCVLYAIHTFEQSEGPSIVQVIDFAQDYREFM